MFNRKLKKEIVYLKTRSQQAQSKIDKLRNQVDDIKEPNTELQDKLISVLLEKNKTYIYKLKEDSQISLRSGLGFVCDFYINAYLENNEPLKFKEISVDDLQKLGKYESFKADGKTYIITNKKLK